ncbi:hypothetical protein M9458_035348, partial [Cirrhinus mrigala]
MPATSENAEASVIAERSSAHCNMAEDELVVDLGLFEAERVFDWDIYADLPPLLPPSSEFTETAMPKLSPEWAPLPMLSLEEAYKFPPFHPLMSPPPLPPSVCLHRHYTLSLPPASESRTPPRVVNPAAPPWLLAPSSLPWPGSPLASPGFLIPPAPPWSVVDHTVGFCHV